jgi:TetR/AcrR family transcriptional repressor of nem operon
MRYDTNHKERTRARLLAQAAAEVRARGVERVSVARVMAGAGLTHGGFYAHFGSKDDMIAQAITHMFDAAYAKFLSYTERREPADGLARYVDGYLRESHRVDRAHGCPIAALASDLPNMPEVARARFTDGAERLAAGIAKLLRNLGLKDADALAWSALAEMTGALVLSRAVSSARRAARILQSSRATVRARLGLAAAATPIA